MSGCIEWEGAKDSKGYGQMSVKGKKTSPHRCEWEFHNGKIPEGLVVRHKCDNPACFNIEHLELGTQADNVRDMHERGRARPAKGEKHGRAKLTDQQVAEIRASKESGGEMAKRFGVSRGHISLIRRGLSRAA